MRNFEPSAVVVNARKFADRLRQSAERDQPHVITAEDARAFADVVLAVASQIKDIEHSRHAYEGDQKS